MVSSFLLVESRWVNDVDACVVAPSEPIHATEALRHTLKSRKVAYEVIGGNIHADFACAGADEIDGLCHPRPVRAESV